MAKKMKQLRSAQSVIPIADVTDDFIMTTDYRFFRVLEISPVNFDLRSPDEQEIIIKHFAEAVATFPPDVHIKVLTTPSKMDDYITDLKQCYMTEESDKCRELIVNQADMLDQISTCCVMRRFFLTFEYQRMNRLRYPKTAEIAESLSKTEDTIRKSLEKCGNFVVSRPERDYILSVLYESICREQAAAENWEAHKQKVIDNYEKVFGETDETLIPVTNFIRPEIITEPGIAQSTVFQIGGRYFMYLYIPSDTYPTFIDGAWLQDIYNSSAGVDVDFYFHKQSPTFVAEKLRWHKKNNLIRMAHKTDYDDDYGDIQDQLDSADYIRERIQNHEDVYVMSCIITVSGSSVEVVEAKYRSITEDFLRMSWTPKPGITRFQQEDMFLATMLTGWDPPAFRNKAGRNAPTGSLASSYPFTAYELCDRDGILMGLNAYNGSPVMLDPFSSGRISHNGLIVGSSGSGKSFTASLIALRLRQKAARVLYISPIKARELYRMTEAIGGICVRIAPDSAQTINVMEIRHRDTELTDMIDGISASSKGSLLSAKIQQLHSFFSLVVADITPTEKNALDEAIIATYKKFGITARNSSLYENGNPKRYKRMPVLGDLYQELQNVPEAKRLKDGIQMFVTGSARSMNAQTNVDLNNKFVMLDVNNATPEMTQICMFIALDACNDLILGSRTGVEHKMLFCDEMWSLINASPECAAFITTLYRTCRSAGAGIVGITQSIQDILTTDNSILENSTYNFLLPMDRKSIEEVNKLIPLTEHEKAGLMRSETLTAAETRSPRNALLVAGTNHVFVTVRATDTEYKLITTSADDYRKLAEEKMAGGRK